MKRLLLAFGVVLLAVAGAVVAWKLADDDRDAGALTPTGPQVTATAIAPTVTVATGPSMRSLNGAYSIVVDNNGIKIHGPNGSVDIDSAGVLVKSSSNTVRVAPGSIDVIASGDASIDGTVVRLGCTSGGSGVAWRNSTVALQAWVHVGRDGGTGIPVQGSAWVNQGSNKVRAC